MEQKIEKIDSISKGISDLDTLEEGKLENLISGLKKEHTEKKKTKKVEQKIEKKDSISKGISDLDTLQRGKLEPLIAGQKKNKQKRRKRNNKGKQTRRKRNNKRNLLDKIREIDSISKGISDFDILQEGTLERLISGLISLLEVYRYRWTLFPLVEETENEKAVKRNLCYRERRKQHNERNPRFDFHLYFVRSKI